MIADTRAPMSPEEMRQVLNFGPEGQVIWMGADPRDTFDHNCGGPYGPRGTYVSEWKRPPYWRRPGLACRRPAASDAASLGCEWWQPEALAAPR